MAGEDQFDPLFGDALPMGTRIGPAILGGAIGQGAEGLVYLAEHDRLGRVVVKEFWPKQIASRSNSGVVRVSQPGWQEAYRKACRAFAEKGERLCQLPPHPGIVRFHEVIDANGTFYLVMDQVQGIPLATLLSAGKALEPGQVRDLADALTAGAAHLHANDLIHRDIAPDNIIVGGDMSQATLIDLNAAKDEVQEGSQSLQGLVKAGYSPFEQYIGASNELDARGDIYAIAAVLIHAITGARPQVPLRRSELGPTDPDPFTDLPPGKHNPGFIAALRHGFALRAADRPGSIVAWRAELGLESGGALPPQPLRAPIQWRKPLLGGLGALALIGGGFGLRAAWNAWPANAAGANPTETASDAADAKDGEAAKIVGGDGIDPDNSGGSATVSGPVAVPTVVVTQTMGPQIVPSSQKSAIQSPPPSQAPAPPRQPVCQTVYKQEQQCATAYRTEKQCSEQATNKTLTSRGDDEFYGGGMVHNASQAESICRPQAKNRARPDLEADCDGELGSITATCYCDYDSSSSTGASCSYTARATCRSTKQVCNNVNVPYNNCQTVNVPQQVCN